MRAWFEEFLRKNRLGKNRLTYDQLSENPPHSLLGVTLNQYLASLDEFRLSRHYEQLVPNKEILNWFKMYGHCCHHLALTAVPLKAAPLTSAWVLKYFGKWIRTFAFIPSKRAKETITVYDCSKADFIGRHGKIDILIDDNAEQIEKAAQIGVQGVLISQPWNAGRGNLSEVIATLTSAVAH